MPEPRRHSRHPQVPTFGPHHARTASSTKSSPYHEALEDVSTPPEFLEVEQTTGHQFVRGRGGVIAVLYEIHRTGLLSPSWERELDLQHFRRHILLYWSGTPTQAQQANSLYRQMRIGAAQRELSSSQSQLFLARGYTLVSRDLWLCTFSATILPCGAYTCGTRLATASGGSARPRALGQLSRHLLHDPLPRRPGTDQDRRPACALLNRPGRQVQNVKPEGYCETLTRPVELPPLPQQSTVASYACFGWFRLATIPTIPCFRFGSCICFAFYMFSTLVRSSLLLFLFTTADPACLLSIRLPSRGDNAPSGAFVLFPNPPPTILLGSFSQAYRIAVTLQLVFVVCACVLLQPSRRFS